MGERVTMLDDPDRVVGALGPLRRSILALLGEPDSATGLAERLGTTRQKVNYHLRALEEAGLVELVATRRRRGFSERLLRRTADVLVVDPTTFDVSGLTTRDAIGVAGVTAVATDLVRQAGAVASAAAERGERVVAATLDTAIRVETPAALRALLDDLATVVAAHDAGDRGLAVRVATVVLPEEASDG